MNGVLNALAPWKRGILRGTGKPFDSDMNETLRSVLLPVFRKQVLAIGPSLLSLFSYF